MRIIILVLIVLIAGVVMMKIVFDNLLGAAP